MDSPMSLMSHLDPIILLLLRVILKSSQSVSVKTVDWEMDQLLMHKPQSKLISREKSHNLHADKDTLLPWPTMVKSGPGDTAENHPFSDAHGLAHTILWVLESLLHHPLLKRSTWRTLAKSALVKISHWLLPRVKSTDGVKDWNTWATNQPHCQSNSPTLMSWLKPNIQKSEKYHQPNDLPWFYLKTENSTQLEETSEEPLPQDTMPKSSLITYLESWQK